MRYRAAAVSEDTPGNDVDERSPLDCCADAEVTRRFFGNNEFSGRLFAAIAKLNYGATLELKLAGSLG